MTQRFRSRPPCGVLILNKPAGLTSREAVDYVFRPLKGNKVGHAGTLDPLASGVLVVCVGAATRLIESVQRLTKTYRTVVRLGARSDTLDADGRVVAVTDPPVPGEGEVQVALASQVGTILQIPPQFSALKVAGRRAYDLARAGRTVDLAARSVTVHRVDLFRYAWPCLELEIECGGGTYIRSIARDVGEALGCGGLVEELVRTRIGPFTLAEALDPASLAPSALPCLLRPALEAVPDLPRLVLTAGAVTALVQGQSLPLEGLAGPQPASGEVALVGPDGELVALGEAVAAAGRLFPRRVLAGG